MNNTELIMLETDLGYLNPPQAVVTYLGQLLAAAEEAITAKGITLDHESAVDRLLIVSYAAWLYRKRDSGAGMPRPLEYQLRCRIVQSAGGGQA